MLLRLLANVLDYSPSSFTSDQILSEARNKLTGTYMFLNNTLVCIHEINTTSIIYTNMDGDSHTKRQDEIESLRVFLPECGVYLYNRLPFLLTKKSKKQWRKSFCWSYYIGGGIDNTAAYHIANQNPISDVYRYNNLIMYLDIKIGVMIGDMLLPKCTNKLFQSEFDEFIQKDKK